MPLKQCSLLLLLFVTVLFVSLAAQDQITIGIPAAGFLSLPTTAEGSGMGETGVAIDRGLSWQFWNPANGANAQAHEVAAFYQHYDRGLAFWNVSLGTGDRRVGIFSMHFRYWGAGTVSPNLWNIGAVDDNRVNANDFSVSFNYARLLGPSFSVGGAAKLVSTHFNGKNGNISFLFDVGAIFRSTIFAFNDNLDGVRFGLSLANLGEFSRLTSTEAGALMNAALFPADSTQKIGMESPSILRLGASYEMLKKSSSHITLSIELEHSNFQTRLLNVGAQLQQNFKPGGLWFAAGYKGLNVGNYGPTLAFGVDAGKRLRKVRLGYSFMSNERWGGLHGLSLGIVL